jgi:hypothetical protein
MVNTTHTDGIRTTTQPLLKETAYSTAWQQSFSADNASVELLVSTVGPLNGSEAESTALRLVSQASGGVDALLAAHVAWWQAFYAASSFLTLTNSIVESFYWIQVYKLGAITRRDAPSPTYTAIDHTGERLGRGRVGGEA